MAGTVTLHNLVTAAAAELMAATAATSAVISERVLGTLVEHLGQDFGFLRHNDHTIHATVLIAEFPPRNADPDPIGVVYFSEADSVFAKTEYLKEPEVLRPEPDNADYQQTITEGTGFPPVSLATVPLLSGDVTTGILGFGKLGDRAWSAEELNALQAIATLFAQLQARIVADKQIRYLAERDDLSGLLNRRTIIGRLDERLAPGMPGPVSIVFLDVDRLKAINGLLGQEAGDGVIRAIGESLRQATDIRAAIARFGGDEFLLVPEDPMDSDSAMKFARRLQSHLQARVNVEGALLARTVSIGVATGAPGCDSSSALLSRADQATRSAKISGGATVAAFSPQMATKEAICNELELRLQEADASADLVLHYLPEFDMRTGEVLGAEALIRWQHPTRGLLTPEWFIDAAESITLAGTIGRLVIRSGCAQFARWQSRGLAHGAVLSINVSPLQLVAEGLVDMVGETLDEFGLDASAFCLEITERVVVADVKAARNTLTALKDIGVRIALDDFGTGYSSFEYLTSLPVDAVKLDQGFIRDLGGDPHDQAVVKSILAVADALGLDVVAEGVETARAAATLLELGCRRAQGFLFSRPLVSAAMESLFAERIIALDFSDMQPSSDSPLTDGPSALSQNGAQPQGLR
jgi:diguanylate cyclase (GGDEF)-like protein